MMAVSRRGLIVGAGATTLALIGGAGFWRVTRLPRTAAAPWMLDEASPADVRLDAFRHAILAPNPHNRQPWLIKLDGKDGASISCDLNRRLPETDPFDRQITIGFGTFLELARIAAAERGVRMEITPFPDGEPQPRLDTRPIARLRFIPDSAIQRDPLFAVITKRRTTREPYDLSRPVPDSIARQISDGGYTTDSQQIAAIRAIAMAGIKTEQMIPRTNMESVQLMRIGHDQVDANPDGISLTGPLMEALKLAGQLDHQALGDPTSSSFQTGIDMMQDIYGSVPAAVWIITPGNSRLDQLEAGRRYVRANLRATLLGVAMHPLSQSLQEYDEVAGLFKRIHAALGAKPGERLQMLARIGYGPQVEPAPRWPLETHLRA
jgi:hypothetical protein